MKKVVPIFSLTVVISLFLTNCNDSVSESEVQRKELDSLLLHETKIPVKFNGGDIFLNSEDSIIDNDQTKGVITKETRRITTTFEKYVAFDPNAPSLYPGALVQGKELSNGILTPLNTARNPLTITISDFYQKGNLSLSRTVPNPNFANVNDSFHVILKQGVNSEQPAKISFSETQVHSMDQAFLSVNASYRWATGAIDGSFSTTKDEKYSKFLVRFIEKYFTVSCAPPTSPSSFIADSANYGNIKNYLASGNPNPLCYVSSVTYGRELWILIESTEKANKVEAALNASFGGLSAGGELHITDSVKKIINESSIQCFIMGGGKKAARTYLAGDKIAGIAAFLKGADKMEDSDPPQPISYVVSYLSDNTLARVSASTDYTIITDKTTDAPSPLTSAMIHFAQGDDGKDQSTGLRLILFDKAMIGRNFMSEIDAISPQAVAYTELYDNTSQGIQFTDNGTIDLAMGLRKKTSNVDLKNGVLIVWMFCHGHDRWQFTPTLNLTFKNGTTKAVNLGACDLNQNNGFGVYSFSIQ